MQRLIIGEAARAANGDIRYDTSLEDHVADCDRLEGTGAVTVMVDRDRRTLAEIGRIEITGVSGGIENQASETTSRDRGDVGDVIDPSEQLDGEIRIVHLDGEGAVGDAGQRSVERQRRRRHHRAVEGRRTGETDLVAQVLARADDELAAGRDIERADADRAAHDPKDAGYRR